MMTAQLTASGWSTDKNDTRRLRVEEGGAGFYDGREFRMFVEFNIPAGGELWVRITSAYNFVLNDQRVSIESGTIRWTANAAMATSPGPWTPATLRRRNQMTEQQTPFFVSGTVIETSTTTGAATGGIVVDAMRIATGVGSGSSTATQNAGKRGLAPNVYHVRLQNPSAQAAVGVYDWWWEERP
jgi:hypothetical protein